MLNNTHVVTIIFTPRCSSLELTEPWRCLPCRFDYSIEFAGRVSSLQFALSAAGTPLCATPGSGSGSGFGSASGSGSAATPVLLFE